MANNNTLNILLLSKGNFEGKRVCNTLFGQNTVGPTRLCGCTINVTSIPILLDGKSPATVVKEARDKIHGEFNAVVIVLALPIRSTPESQKHLNIMKAIVGKKVLQTSSILLFTNGTYMTRNPVEFQQFQANEIKSSQNTKYYDGSLGQLIEEVHYPGSRDWNRHNFNHSLLLDLDSGDFGEKKTQRERLINITKTLHPFNLSTVDNSGYLPKTVLIACLSLMLLLLILFNIKYLKGYITEHLQDRGEMEILQAQLKNLKKEIQDMENKHKIQIEELKIQFTIHEEIREMEIVRNITHNYSQNLCEKEKQEKITFDSDQTVNKSEYKMINKSNSGNDGTKDNSSWIYYITDSIGNFMKGQTRFRDEL